jgi:hypothetical protein
MKKRKNKLIIHTPIFSTQSIGIAAHRITSDLEIEIDYKEKKGERIYPNIYFMKKEDIIKYPTQIHRGIILYIVPIKDLKVKGDK